MRKVIIDGRYLQCVLKESFGETKIDIRRLAEKLAGTERSYSVAYYYPMNVGIGIYTELERERAAKVERFLHAIAAQGVEVKQINDLTLTNQMSVDLTRLTLGGRLDELVLVADSPSLAPALDLARGEGVGVTLWHGPRKTKGIEQLVPHVDCNFILDFDMIGTLRLSA